MMYKKFNRASFQVQSSPQAHLKRRARCAAALSVAAMAGLMQGQTANAATWSGTTSNVFNVAANWGGTLPVSTNPWVFTSATGAGGLNLNNNLTTSSFQVSAIT